LSSAGEERVRLSISLRARLYGLGENDRALDWLELAVSERASSVYGIKGPFLFTSLHAHPRFLALLQTMKLQ
jgi:hypothetical protein